MLPPHLTPGKDPVPIVQEAGWDSGPVWTSAENLAPTGIQSPDRPARRQSLYRLCYPAYPSCHLILVLKSWHSLSVHQQNPKCTFPVSHTCYMPCSSYSSRFDHPNTIWLSITVHEAPHWAISYTHLPPFPLGANIFLNTIFSKTPCPHFSLKVLILRDDTICIMTA